MVYGRAAMAKMTRVLRWTSFVSLMVVAGGTFTARAQKGPAVEDVLKLSAEYLTQYSQKLGAVAAEEEFLQYQTSSGQMGVPKRVISDVVWVGYGGAGERFPHGTPGPPGGAPRKEDRPLKECSSPAAQPPRPGRRRPRQGARAYLGA